MNDDRPKLLGVFPSQFPSWGKGEPHEHDGRPCQMFVTPAGFEVNWQFIPWGVSGIDVNGQLWVLVEDMSIREHGQRYQWRRFPVEFVR